MGSCSTDERQPFITLARMDPAHLDLDPRGSPYGGAYLYALGAWIFALERLDVLHLESRASRYLSSPQDIGALYRSGRTLSVCAFLGVVVVLWSFGSALDSRRVGFLAAAIWSLSPLPLHQALVTKPHVWAALWAILAFRLLFAYTRRPRTRTLLGAAAVLGLAVGTSLSTGLLLAAVPGALPPHLTVGRRLRLLLLAFLVVAAVFVLTNPWFLGSVERYGVLAHQYAMGEGYGYLRPSLAKSLAAARDLTLRSFAWPFGLLGLAGLLGWAFGKPGIARTTAWAWLGAFLVLAAFTGELRYGLFLGPFLCLAAARALEGLAAWGATRGGRIAVRPASRRAVGLLFLPSLLLAGLHWQGVFSHDEAEPAVGAWIAHTDLDSTSLGLLSDPEPQNLPPLPFSRCRLVALAGDAVPAALPDLVVVGNGPKERVRWEAHPARTHYALAATIGHRPLDEFLLLLRPRAEARITAWVYARSGGTSSS